MSEDTLTLQKEGANARALGRSFLDNPFYKADRMPGVTGESVPDWNRKAEAWKFGWEIEDAIRASAPSGRYAGVP